MRHAILSLIRITCTIVTLMLLAPTISAQMDTAWVRTYTHDKSHKLYDAGFDVNGNCYSVFSSYSATVSNYQVAVKYDSAGVFQWSYQSARSSMFDGTIDSLGRTYMTGSRWHVSNSSGMTTKLNSSGVAVFVKDWYEGVTGDGVSTRTITYDKLGNCYVAGAYYNPELGWVDDEFRGHWYEADIGVIGYSATGGELFTTFLPYLYGDDPGDITVSPSGDIYLTGTHVTRVSGSPDRDVRLYKFSSDGTLDWMKEFDDGIVNIHNHAKVTTDPVGNPIIYHTYLTKKFNSSGEQLREYPDTIADHFLMPDPTGAIYIAGGSEVHRLSETGIVLWSTDVKPAVDTTMIWTMIQDVDNIAGGIVVVGMYGDYSHYGYFTSKLDSLGVIEWVEKYDVDDARSYDMYSCVDADESGAVLVSFIDGTARNLVMIKYVESKKSITIRDASNDTIPNTEFEFIRITNDAPEFTADTLGSITTNAHGAFEFTPVAVDVFEVELNTGTHQLIVGDSLKISKHLHAEPAVKHPVTLPTMYSLHLDNARFAQSGTMTFDTLTTDDQNIVLDHTEIRYNLLICLQWDASPEYLRGLDSNLRAMNNYMYDVSDGQIRFDTILVYDAMERWEHADMRIMADNVQWPQCLDGVAGISYPWPFGRNIVMPRAWLGNPTACRNVTDAVHPLALANPKDFRTKVHEFGHYGLGFYDEYMFWESDSGKYIDTDAYRCNPRHLYNYGFMDRQYVSAGDNSSEMSTKYGYALVACQNTEQYERLGLSCWDHLERWVEATTWSPDNVFVPILKPDADDPDERQGMTGEIFVGPNDDIAHPNYDVGKLLVLPRTPQSPAAGVGELHVTVTHRDGGDMANVLLINNPYDPSPQMIRQGNTSDAAGIWVIGADAMDCDIEAYKNNWNGTVTASLSTDAGLGTWLYGGASLGGSGAGRYGNGVRSLSTNDSLTIELVEVAGDYPIIFDLDLEAASSTLRMTCTNMFSAPPTIDLQTDVGTTNAYPCVATATGYDVVMADSLGRRGEIRLWAVDDAGATFLVPLEYNATEHDPEPGHFEFDANGWAASVWIDSVNTSVERGLVLSSLYPVPAAGLGPGAVQAGETHTVALFPESSLTGSNQITIRYDDAELRLFGGMAGDESTLAIYRWNNATSAWLLLGGSVNVESNSVEATIPGEGIYAAFTTDIMTDVDDQEYGDNLPYRFELSQNYPNPFNPVTTIEYRVPERSKVSVEIFNVLGRKVRTLVDREQPAGNYTITWNGTDASSRSLATGVYLYRFQAGDHIETRKMLLLK